MDGYTCLSWLTIAPSASVGPVNTQLDNGRWPRRPTPESCLLHPQLQPTFFLFLLDNTRTRFRHVPFPWVTPRSKRPPWMYGCVELARPYGGTTCAVPGYTPTAKYITGGNILNARLGSSQGGFPIAWDGPRSVPQSHGHGVTIYHVPFSWLHSV